MPRCASSSSSSPSSALRLAALAALLAGAALASLPAAAQQTDQQMTRRFPISELRGRIVFTNPPAITLNGDPAQLSPGVRIHGFDNMMIVTGAVGGDGNKYTVDYRMEGTGLVSEIWLLTNTEAAVYPWPRTSDEAQAWKFDYMAQTWTKP